MRTHVLHMTKAQNSPSAPAGESYRIWRVDGPRPLAHEGGSSAAVRVARVREHHGFDQHAEARAGTRRLNLAAPFLPHRASRVFVGSLKVGFEKYYVARRALNRHWEVLGRLRALL